MNDLIIDVIAAMEAAEPELEGKIQPGVVDSKTLPPYASFPTVNDEPIVTTHGVAGFNTFLQFDVTHRRFCDVVALRDTMIKALHFQRFGKLKCSYREGEYEYSKEVDLHTYSLTFKIV